jgi:exodeoxyribonuclease V alpha subunit
VVLTLTGEKARGARLRRAEREQAELVVEVASLLYRSPDGEFAVVNATAVPAGGEGTAKRIVLTGPIAYLHEGEELVVRGSWREHPRHGLRFEVTQASHAEPSTEAGLVAALSAIKYVGAGGATYLYERYGLEALSVVDRAPRQRLREVPGIGRVRIDGAVRSWEEQRGQRALRMFLGSCGVEAAVASRIYRAWGTQSVQQLRADPYRITRLPGIGFHSADTLAASLGIAADAPERIDAGLLHTLEQAELDGHCYLPRDELERRAAALLAPRDAECGAFVEAEDIAARIRAMCEESRLVSERAGDDEPVYTAEMHALERRLAEDVRTLVCSPPTLDGSGAARPSRGAFVPTDEQWQAVRLALEHRLSILTGGPGTGKTTSMRVLVDLLREAGHTVRLCAPTGKAARRLSAATGVHASTIHQLLSWVPGIGFARNRANRLEGVDMLIVDEVSMLSVRLAEALLAAIDERTHVLLVGDTDQLAAIGPGRVLEDVIASGGIPVTALTEVFRQAQRSLIVRAAHAINHGRRPDASAADVCDTDVIRDFFLIEREREEQVFAEVVSLAGERLASYYDLDPRIDVQVLAPMRRGRAGIEVTNAELRARVNPDGAPVPGTTLRLGDRVIQTRNDHEHGLMNGEVALLEHWDGERERVVLRGDDGRVLTLPLAAIDSFEPAYAISIHKAQGSQAPAIVLALARSHRIMLTRNLIYTGVTRAERVCVVVTQPGALEIALGRRDARRRYTRLGEIVAGSPLAGPPARATRHQGGEGS